MSIKLVATDLDDTLLRNDLTLSQRVITAIHQAKEQGVYVTFATGRMPVSARPYAEQLGLDVPIITSLMLRNKFLDAGICDQSTSLPKQEVEL